MIGNVFQLVFVLICTAGSTYFKNTRTYFMAWNLAVSIVGAAMIREIKSELIWARFMGYCLTLAYSANFPMILSMSSGNVGGFTKKTTVNAMVRAPPSMYHCGQHNMADFPHLDLHRLLWWEYHRTAALLRARSPWLPFRLP